jgi:5-methylcytosine-specific restriction endonuclease McrA
VRQKRCEKPEHFRAIDKLRHERHKARRNALSRQYWNNNLEIMRAKNRQKNLKNKDRYNARRREKYRACPDDAQRKAAFAAHKARKMKAFGRHTKANIRRQFQFQKGLCFWCSRELTGVYHVDHILPLNRGGSNWPANICITCVHCNTSKSDRLPFIEWQPPRPLLF